MTAEMKQNLKSRILDILLLEQRQDYTANQQCDEFIKLIEKYAQQSEQSGGKWSSEILPLINHILEICHEDYSGDEKIDDILTACENYRGASQPSQPAQEEQVDWDEIFKEFSKISGFDDNELNEKIVDWFKDKLTNPQQKQSPLKLSSRDELAKS
jgi:hypothetical protein